MDKCVVYGCPNSLPESDSTVQFHYFPKHPVIAQQWLNSCCMWSSDEIDLSTAKMCSIHFDEDSYTSEYKMMDYGYTRVLKYDALPTLYLPQQAIVYRVTDVVQDGSFPNQNYETSSVIIENIQHNQHQSQHGQELDERNITKYEELQTVAVGSDGCILKLEEPTVSALDEKYRNITSQRQLDEIKLKNCEMRTEVAKMEANISDLKKKLAQQVEETKKKNVECKKLQRILTKLEIKTMPLNEQKSLLAKVFSESQIKILSGKKKIYWSHDDMAVGYTIRHMSSKRCYMYLSKKLNIPLPGMSSIKRWQSLKKNELIKAEKSENNSKNEYSDEMN